MCIIIYIPINIAPYIRYITICLSSAVLAAEFSRFDRYFTQPQPLANSQPLTCFRSL